MTCAQSTALPNIYRNADYSLDLTFPEGFAFSGATIQMQVREYQGAPGSSLLTLSLTETAFGSKFTFIGNRIHLLIEKADLEALPVASPVSDPWVGEYDIIITTAGFVSQYLIGGPFVVNMGVTR